MREVGRPQLNRENVSHAERRAVTGTALRGSRPPRSRSRRLRIVDRSASTLSRMGRDVRHRAAPARSSWWSCWCWSWWHCRGCRPRQGETLEAGPPPCPRSRRGGFETFSGALAVAITHLVLDITPACGLPRYLARSDPTLNGTVSGHRTPEQSPLWAGLCWSGDCELTLCELPWCHLAGSEPLIVEDDKSEPLPQREAGTRSISGCPRRVRRCWRASCSFSWW